MTQTESSAVFFDPAVLGMERATWDGERMEDFTDYPQAREILQALGGHARLGVLAFDPSLEPERLRNALDGTALGKLLTPSLVLVAHPDDEDPFARAVSAADLDRTPERALYVGLDAALRAQAAEAGLRVAPHPALARAVLDGEELRYVRASVEGVDRSFSWAPKLERLPVVPILITHEPEPALYAVAPTSALEDLEKSEATLERLGKPEDVTTGSLSLMQMTPEQVAASAPLRSSLAELPSELPVVRETPSGPILAIPGSRTTDEFHPRGVGHGHNRALAPDLGLLRAAPAPGELVARAVEPEEMAALAQLDANLYRKYFEPCCGITALQTPNGTMRITSRHIHHPGNAHATDGLELALTQICGKDHTCRRPVSSLAGLFNIEAEIPGVSDELVIVGAHLDSTAVNTSGYRGKEAIEAAPGADDDASGVAGVLAAAHVLKALSQTARPQRTIRFVLFNAEEQGMVGSDSYAKSLKQLGARVTAMFQMDMIGWLRGSYPYPKAAFEVHGTGEDEYSGAYESCQRLVNLVAKVAPQVSPSLVPQTYPLAGSRTDPATHRSDHDSFQYHDWPACLVAEDLWVDVCQSTMSWTGNPDYHEQSDTAVRVDYAADVARVVAAAAWVAANPASASVPSPDTRGTGDEIKISDSRTSDAGKEEVITETESASATHTKATEGSDTMPTVFLVEFLARWIRDEEFRRRILHKELTTLKEEGMTDYQINDLMSLDKETIIGRLVKELEEDLEIDLAKLKKEVLG